MGIEKRLQLIMASNRLTASSFADTIGVQRSNVSHILNGRNKPGYDFLLKVIHAFPKVSTHWLITGEEKRVEDEPLSTKQIEIITEKTPATTIVDHKSGENVQNEKRIIKTVVFYDDFTFDAFLPSEK